MKSSLLTLLLLGAVSLAAHAAPNDGIVGGYFRIDGGRSTFDVSSGSQPQGSAENHGLTVKLFGGYRFNEHVGVELGYAALGSFSQDVTVGGTGSRQDGKARSLFAVGTGRLPMRDSFALHGRLGVSSGKVSGTDTLPPGASLMGSRNSAMVGLGLEYRPRKDVALTLGYDSYGKLSNNVKASALLFGLHIGL